MERSSRTPHQLKRRQEGENEAQKRWDEQTQVAGREVCSQGAESLCAQQFERIKEKVGRISHHMSRLI